LAPYGDNVIFHFISSLAPPKKIFQEFLCSSTARNVSCDTEMRCWSHVNTFHFILVYQGIQFRLPKKEHFGSFFMSCHKSMIYLRILFFPTTTMDGIEQRVVLNEQVSALFLLGLIADSKWLVMLGTA